MNEPLIPAGVRGLLGRLKAYKVEWAPERIEGAGYDPGADRVEAPLSEANVVSSILNDVKPILLSEVDELLGNVEAVEVRHIVALDVDYPAYAVPSSTPGHHHVYLDVPGGLTHGAYMEILEVLGRHGVIEPGYAEVSRKRGHTDLRPPWVRKEDGDSPNRVYPPLCCTRCNRAPSDIPEYVDCTLQHWYEENPEAEADEHSVSELQITEWVWQNEGTLNKQTGYFACTDCYIAMGQPSSPRGWTPNGPDTLEPLEAF